MEKTTDKRQDTTNSFYIPPWLGPRNLYERMVLNRIKRLPPHLREDALGEWIKKKSKPDNVAEEVNKSNTDQSLMQNEEFPTPEQLVILRRRLKVENTTAEAALEKIKAKEANDQPDNTVDGDQHEQNFKTPTEEITQPLISLPTNTVRNDSSTVGGKSAGYLQKETKGGGDYINKGSRLTSEQAFQHYKDGSGTPLRISFDQIDTTSVSVTDFKKLREALSEKRKGTVSIDDRLAFTTSGDNF